MIVRYLPIAVVLVFILCASTETNAATITVTIDNQTVEVPVEQGEQPSGKPIFYIGSEEEPFTFETDNGRVILGGALDPDPSITFGSAVFDFGAPSVFGFTIILPLSPTYSNPTFVKDSFSGSVTNGPAPQADGGVTVTALPPLSGVPVDGDSITEMEVFTLSDDGGATWKNVGLDLGTTEFVPLAPGDSAATTVYNEGFISTIAGGPWTHMRADITFSLSGFGDVFTFNGAKTLVPEPSSALLALFSLALCLCRRGAVRR